MKSKLTEINYRNAMLRLIQSASRIAEVSGRPPCVMDLFRALALRSRKLSRQSTHLDMYALRDFIREARFNPETGAMLKEKSEIPCDWLESAHKDEWEDLYRHVNQPRPEIIEMSDRIVTRIKADIEEMLEEGSEDEIFDQLACLKSATANRHSLKDMRAIGLRDMRTIEMLLSQYDPYRGLDTIPQGNMLEARGVARIFALTAWATGMRPAEMWSCRVMAPKPDRPMTDEMRTLIRENPREAILAGLMIEIEKLERSPTESLGRLMARVTTQTGAPALLIIRSAKQKNANSDIRSSMRIQILEGIPENFADMIALSSQMRHFNPSEKRREIVRKSVNRALQDVTEGEPSLADVKITLYAFRHAFATRVKRDLSRMEAAALTGHTSPKSLFMYGQRRDMTTRRKSRDQWTPRADPVQVRVIEAAWNNPGAASTLEISAKAT